MKKMINRWLEKEIINQELANVMLKDIEEEKARKSRIKLNICIYTIATILIGIGVLAFISANDWLLKIFTDTPVLQIVVMLILTISSLFFGYKMAYETNKFPKLGHSMIFLSSLLIGGTYALTGQNYNINANNSGLCFLWMISIIPVAYVFKNFAINIVAIILYILGVIFYYLELSIDNGDTWTIFIPIILGVSFYTIGNIPAIIDKFEKFSLTYKIIGLKLIYFVLLILTCFVETSYQLVSPYYITPIIFLIILNYLNYVVNKEKNLLCKIETSYMLILLLTLFIMITSSNVSEIFVILFANLAIIVMIATGYNYGYKLGHANVVNVSNWFLIIYLIVNYFHFGWDMMDKSLFFLLGGIGLLKLGMFLEDNRKKLMNKDN